MEYPCQNRNAAGVSNALIAAEMSLAGITQFIPLDEMIDTMYAVGKKLPAELRETALAAVQPHHLPVRNVIFAAEIQLWQKKSRWISYAPFVAQLYIE